jgi:hypothetical protein
MKKALRFLAAVPALACLLTCSNHVTSPTVAASSITRIPGYSTCRVTVVEPLGVCRSMDLVWSPGCENKV